MRKRHLHTLFPLLGVLLLLANPVFALNATWNAATDVPVTSAGYIASGVANLTLNFGPTTGTTLTVVNNTGLGFISGTFSNLPQGQTVTMACGGVQYSFIANYYGGTGNDLVLQWAQTRPVAWGYNDNGELGDGSATHRFVPTDVLSTGVLAGKTVIAVSAGQEHTLALCSDGTLAAWGWNFYGQLGNNSTTSSPVPVAVVQSGALSGKKIVAVCAGGVHSLALCSDGTLAAWGWNFYGQLGDNTSTDSPVPVTVLQSGALAGKTVTSMSAGWNHCLALCSDGTLAAWGWNFYGQLGDNSTTSSPVAVAVVRSGVLSGKTVLAVAAGNETSLALCSDGMMAAWGDNFYGQLGNNSTTDSPVPVPVIQSGVLAGKTIVKVAAGGFHNLALCADGTVIGWGHDLRGQLGDNSTTSSLLPVAVDQSDVLAGRTVTAIFAAGFHSLALCSDGTLATWGASSYGELGDNSTEDSSAPVMVSNLNFATGERFATAGTGPVASHSLALVASPPTPALPPAWRQAWFGSPGNMGNAADTADPYGTGIPNLALFALLGPGQNPRSACVAQLPQTQTNGGNFFYNFLEPAGVSGVTYGAEWSVDLTSGIWQAVPDSGAGTQHIFSIPIGANPQLFLRLKVMEP